ncbi:Cysteine alpha-hairpin motif superfamily [Sesbania bispinosa]|nr:Cysteine alpha-hairpin motif superfamily [Sesbania bispinosa]
MGEFTIQISNDLVDQLVDDTVTKKKTRRIRRKVPRQTEKPQSNVTEKPESAAAPGWPVQPPLFLPATLPVQPAHSELDGIRSVLQESEKVLERLQKQEENMLQEVTQKAKDLHDREYKLPNPKPEPCMAERLATLACYKEHIKDPLKCAGHVTNFADCLRKFGRLGGK